jgi:heme/copper-type cytochrome/quinol oxidase subunit 4
MATADIAITGAAIAGMIIALVWRGIVPYLLKRKEAEENGKPIPSFSTTYLTTFIISVIGGLVSVMMVINELEVKLVGITSVMTAAAIGLTFTYTFLSGFNTLVDLKTSNTALQTKIDPAAVKDAELDKKV